MCFLMARDSLIHQYALLHALKKRLEFLDYKATWSFQSMAQGDHPEFTAVSL